MRKHLLGIIALLAIVSPQSMMAWWQPSEQYCRFINRFEIDKVWKFNPTIEDKKPFAVPNNCVPTLEDCPGYIAWQVVTWDNHRAYSDDYDLDSANISLKDDKGRIHKIVMFDCLAENTDHTGSDSANLVEDGNVNTNYSDAKWFRNYNGNVTRYCNKYLYPDLGDGGLQYAYFITKYSDQTLQFIKEATKLKDTINIVVQASFDNEGSSEYAKYIETSAWKPNDRKIQTRPSPILSINNIDFVDNTTNNKTYIRMTIPAKESSANRAVYTLYGPDGVAATKIQTNTFPEEVNWETDYMKSRPMLEYGEYRIEVQHVRDYYVNIIGYDKLANNIIDAVVPIGGEKTIYYIPQMKLAKDANAFDNKNGTLTVSWRADKPTRNRNNSEWLVKYCTDGLFNAATVQQCPLITYNDTQENYSVTINVPERDKQVKYYFRISRNNEITQREGFYAECNVLVDTKYPMANKPQTTTSNDSVWLQLTMTDGLWSSTMRRKLFRDGKEIPLANADKPILKETILCTNVPYCTPTEFAYAIYEGDKVCSYQIANVTTTSTKAGEISRLTASKGYFNNRVQLRWNVNSKKDNLQFFSIERKVYKSNSKYSSIESNIEMQNGVHEYTYTDYTAQPGVYYTYRVVGYKVCNDTPKANSSVEDIGFTQPYGVVTGQVLFENGQAVANAVVQMMSDSYQPGASLETSETGYLTLNYDSISPFSMAGAAVEMTVRLKTPTANSIRHLLWQQGVGMFGFSGDTLYAQLYRNGLPYRVAVPLSQVNEWRKDDFNHVAMSYFHEKKQLTIDLYVNGKKAVTQTFSGIEREIDKKEKGVIHIAYGEDRGQKAPLNGFVDEIRLWSTYRTEEQVGRFYDCFLSGKEVGLSAYYHCDLIMNEQTFDISGDGSYFNERHLNVVNNVVCNTTYIPSPQQMGLRSRTDVNGNYLINAAPYTKQGTLYTLLTTLGVHQFSPATKTLFFDDNASTHNNIDFTDISSFNVSGTVMIAGGNYPVEGVQFKVDGVLQLSRSGGAIQTDEKGHFSLSVPVGIHSVQAFMPEHKLTNNGYITEIDGTDINYQSNISDLKIYDSTLVRFVGRICGGDIQGSKTLGFSLSRNNLEDGMYLRLQHNHPDKYQLASQVRKDTLLHVIPSVNLIDTLNRYRDRTIYTNVVEYGDNYIKIFVNDSTGEFYADVPPIDYTIGLTTSHYGNANENGEKISFRGMLPSAVIKMPHTYVDSVVTGYKGDGSTLVFSTPREFSDTVTFNKQKVFIFRSDPILEFYQVDYYGKRLPYYGEQVIAIPTENDEFKPVVIYDPTKKNPYTLSRPLFKEENGYTFCASLGEVYRHYNMAGKIVGVDSVPVKNPIFKVSNTMSTKRTETITGDEAGKASYSFVLTEPDLIKAEGQIALEVVYNNGKNTRGWESPFANGLCYYTGTKKTSGDFITAGPNQLITILRDPPGTNSYSYLDAGHTIQNNNSYCYTSYENGKVGTNLSLGISVAKFVGIGLLLGDKKKSVFENKTAWEHERKYSSKTNFSTTITTTQRFSTSSDELYVGADGDVFVGSSTNYSLATANIVQLVERNNYLKHGKDKYPRVFAWTADSMHVLTYSDGVSCNQTFNTTFSYTQRDIVNEEMPRLEKLLRTILLPYNKDDSARYASLATKEQVAYYMLNKDFDPKKHEYGAENTYFMIKPHFTDGQVHIIGDTVCAIRGWVNRWKGCLGLNEYQKWKAFQNRGKNTVLLDNYSISGGSTLSMTEQYATSMAYSQVYENKNGFLLDHGQKQSADQMFYFGISLIVEEHVGSTKQTDMQTTEKYSHTKGFVLAPNAVERLSVDVLHEHDWNISQEMNPHGEWNGEYDKSLNNTNREASDVIGSVQSLESYPSFIFYTRGGQTCCPYEPELKAQYMELYLKEQIRIYESMQTWGDSIRAADLRNDLAKIENKSVVINGPTLSVDKPQIVALKTFVGDIPSGENAYIPIQMSNHSESETDRPYYLVFKENSNHQGLSVSVDGTALGTGLTGGSGVSFLIPAGTTLNKTLSISKGSALNYDDITLYLVTGCGSVKNKLAIKDSCTFSVHFTPSCSAIDIKLPNTGWVYNTLLETDINPATKKTQHFMPVVLHNFDVNYTEFDHIELQYKPSSDNSEQWRKVHYFYRDSASLKEAIKAGKDSSQVSICQGGTITYKLFLDDLDDQQYDLRAATFCRLDNQLQANYSDVVSGIKDTYQPRLYGSAKPTNGIFGVNDELSITFNEPISAGKLTYNNFSVSGLLDEALSDRSISVHLDQEGTIKSQASFRLKNQFTIEGYFRQTDTEGIQNLLQIGNYPNQISLSLVREEKTMILSVDTSMLQIGIDTNWVDGVWNHVALVCQTNALDEAELYLFLNFNKVASFTAPADIVVNGRLTLGGNYIGDIDQVRVWSQARSLVLLRQASTIRYSNPVLHLVSCYNMDEDEGTTLEDIAGGRTLYMQNACSWVVPAGKSLYFDGESYATLPISQSSISIENDYTVEFWFRTAEATNVTLLTTGRFDDENTDNTFTVGLNASGKLFVRSASAYAEVSKTAFQPNDTWKHFVFSVSRTNGFARLYIDGNLLATIPQSKVGTIAGSRLYLGAMVDRYSDTSVKDSLSQYFTGYIDEVRIWNFYRPQYQVAHSCMEKPDSTSIGLLSYYPFERYQQSAMGRESLVFSLNNFCQGKSAEKATLFKAEESKESAPVITGSPITRLDHQGYTFTPKEDGILFTLSQSIANRLENAILTFTVQNVFDQNGNKMGSPVSWSVYVDRNPLMVDSSEIVLTTPVGQSATFDLNVTNRGGMLQSFTIENIPSWLDYEALDAIVYPNSTTSLRFTSSDGLSIGTHTAILYLINDDQMVIPIQVTVVVEGNAPEEFTDAEQYPYLMSIMGRIEINGIASSDLRDMLLVYDKNNTCVGSAHTAYFRDQDAYYVSLQVFSKSVAADELYYVIYDASTGTLYKALCNLHVQKFKSNAVFGTPASPAIFFNQKEIYRKYDLTSGWNWTSFNLVPSGGWAVNNVLGNEWSKGDLIKLFNGSQQSDFSANQKTWKGTLQTINANSMYMVHVGEDNSFVTLGKTIDPASVHIPIVKGWNGIGYLPQVNLSVKEAMSLFTDVVNGDVLKSQTQFAIYYNGAWVGSLTTMRPGEGYMLRHNGSRTTLTYPSVYALASTAHRRQAIPYQTTMSLLAKPVGVSAHEGDMLTVYCQEEVVGQAALTSGVWYVSISAGNNGDDLTFVYTNAEGEEVSSTHIPYEANGVLGEPNAPQPIEFRTAHLTLVAYPSPVKEILFYLLDGAETYAIYSLTGNCLQQGKATGQAWVRPLPAGVYILEVSTEQETFRTTFMKE